MSSHLQIVQRRSVIGRPWQQRRILKGLGLRGIGSRVTLENERAVRGMVRGVFHLVEVTEVLGPKAGGGEEL